MGILTKIFRTDDFIPKAERIQNSIRNKNLDKIKKQLWQADRLPLIVDVFNMDEKLVDKLASWGYKVEQDDRIGYRYSIDIK